jgi:hypothetical protein
VPTALKSGSLNFLELSGSVQACNGITLPFLTFVRLIPRELDRPVKVLIEQQHTINETQLCEVHIIIIIVIIIIINRRYAGYLNCIPETNYVFRVYIIAAIL